MNRDSIARSLPLMLAAMLLVATPVAANGLPMGVLGAVGTSAGGMLYPADNTPISVIDETLVLDLRHEDTHVSGLPTGCGTTPTRRQTC